jgi:hypothetical protein
MRKAVAELLEAAGITTILVTHDQAEALVLRRPGGGDARRPRRSFLVRSTGMHAPPAGSAVQLSILGAAHVFALP